MLHCHLIICRGIAPLCTKVYKRWEKHHGKITTCVNNFERDSDVLRTRTAKGWCLYRHSAHSSSLANFRQCMAGVRRQARYKVKSNFISSGRRPIMSCLLTFFLGAGRLRTVRAFVGRPSIAGTINGYPSVTTAGQSYHILFASYETPELNCEDDIVATLKRKEIVFAWKKITHFHLMIESIWAISTEWLTWSAFVAHFYQLVDAGTRYAVEYFRWGPEWTLAFLLASFHNNLQDGIL